MNEIREKILKRMVALFICFCMHAFVIGDLKLAFSFTYHYVLSEFVCLY